jgi:hypothetical protein
MLALLCTASGCQRVDGSKLSTAPADGQYVVWEKANSLPQMSADLKKGAPVGFERRSGDVFVVLGDKRSRIAPDHVSGVYIQYNGNPPFNIAP